MRALCIFLVRVYQYSLGPLLRVLNGGPMCRHTPSCSNYAIQAFRKHGVFKGFWLSLKRLLRCHPWGTSGDDPVP